ncbi:MAG TPA: tape measure protein [Telluria sp.]|nr:tape measure protein [Telluria sp.]
MATVATLDTVMRLNSTAFRQGMVQAANQANASLSAISKKASETASVLLSLKRAAETFGSFYLLKEGLGSLLEAQVQLQAIHYTLIAATGSSSKAADAFGFVRAEADRLGLILPDAAQGFANLSASATAAGVSMKDQQQLFDAYAKSATSLHLSTVQSNRALLALEQMFAKGKIQAQELRLQLGQAIPGAAQRFQNAVMEMTKGTDLAGKSFDQLLEAGALTTSKFLPALVSALQQSGRGWEDASKGLNASLNRVQTAWFNLKTELTNGLFTDVATAGASALADNLSRIAGLVTIIGAGGLAKIGGTALNSGADRVTRLQQEYQGARMAAAAEVTYASKIEATAAANLQRAEASALENQVIKDAAAAALADAKAREIEAFSIKEAALAEMQRVEAAAALNETMAAGAVAKRTAVELDVRLAATSEALIVAEAQLSKELGVQAAARNTLALAEGRQAALRGGVLEASAAASAASATAAKVRTAEAALGGFAAAAGRAAKSFGTFAMSLVGGPWGLAIAAIGGLGYAIYSVQKQGEDWRAETEAEVKSLQQVTTEAKAAAEGFNTYWDARNHSSGVDAFAEGAKAVSKVRGEVADLTAQAAELQKGIDSRGFNEGTAIANWFDQRKLDQINARITELSANLPAASSAVDVLGGKVSYGLLPAVDALKGGLDRLRAGANLKGIWDGLTDGFAAGDKALDDAKAKVGTLQAEMAAIATKNEKDLKTRGKSQLQIQQQNLKDIEVQIRAQSNLTKAEQDAQIAAAKKGAAPQLKLAAQDDAARNAKKNENAIKSQENAYLNLKNAQDGQIKSLNEQIEAGTPLKAAQKELNLMLAGGEQSFRKLTAAEKAERIEAQRRIVTLTLQSIALKQTTKDAEAWAAAQEQLANIAVQSKRAQEDALAAIGQGSQEVTRTSAIRALKREYEDLAVAANKAAIKGEISAAERDKQKDAYKAQLDDQLKALDQSNAAIDAAKANWDNGFKSGIANFMVEQQDNAKRAEQMVTDFTSGFSSAFTDFASGAASASDAFGGMIDNMYKKALAFVADKAIQALFDSFGMSGKNATPGSSAGGWGSILGNLASSFGFGGPSTIGAGLANGGPVAPGSVHQVAEQGPEVLNIGGKSYLLMGSQGGNVIPNHQLGNAGGGNVTNITSIINVQPTSTRRTADQIATANARTQRIAATRAGA